MRSGRGVLLGVAAVVCLGLWSGLLGDEGPDPIPFGVHRLDMALLGIGVALLGVVVEQRRPRRRRSFLGHLRRGLALRIGLLVVGAALLHLGAAVHSRDYWDYSMLSLGFHVLGPARMMAEQSLLLSGFGLCCTAEVLNHLLATSLFGSVAVVYVFAALDALVLALLGMAGERGLPPFRVFQVVSRIALTTALVSLPLAVYRGPVGYWGIEPFAWLFVGLALFLLVPSALKRD